MAIVDRRDGVVDDLGIKRPCRVVATSNITLSGFQSIDGVALTSADANLRVLLTAQTSAVDNGIYVASSGVWERAKDFDGAYDIVKGSLIFITHGTTYASTMWRVSADDPITVGTTSLTFVQYPSVAQDDLAAIEALTGTGGLYRTAANTWALLGTIPLSADTTFYVRTGGLDDSSRSGLVNDDSNAFATPQFAFTTIIGRWNFNNKTVTIQIADGTYTASGSPVLTLVSWIGAGGLTVLGNTTTPTSVVFSSTSADAIRGNGVLPGVVTIRGVKVQTTTSGYGVNNQAVGKMVLGSSGNNQFNFGACATAHLAVTWRQATIEANPYTISGDAPRHIDADNGSMQLNAGTFVLDGARTIPVFARARNHGKLISQVTTWSGSNTGQRFTVEDGAAINPQSNDRDHFPGNSAGTATTGGVYGGTNPLYAIGPSSSTDNAMVRWDGANGNELQSSTVIVSDTGAVSGITTLATTGAISATVAGNAATFVNTTDNASVQIARFEGDRATMADGDAAYVSFLLSNDGGTQTEFGRLTWTAVDVNAGTSVDGSLTWAVNTAGTLANELVLTGTALTPFANDGLQLGSTSLSFADFFLASGGVINWNNGTATLTESAGALTVSGAFTANTAFTLNRSGTQPSVILSRTDTHGDATGVGDILFRGVDSGAATQEYAKISARAVLDNAAAEEGELELRVTTGGAEAEIISIVGGGPIVRPATAIPAGGSLLVGWKATSTADFGVFFGSGAPSLSAAKGSLYLRSDGSATNNRAYIATDSAGTWTAITTVA